MNFFDLTADTLRQYVDCIRVDPAPFWFFHHIPKTAGSSLSGEMSANIGTYRNVVPDYHDETRPFDERLDQSVNALIRDMSAGSLRCASGHLFERHVRQILDTDKDAKLFTFLRHPLKRSVSEYNYNSSEAHPPYRSFQARYPTYESFALDPKQSNKMSHYLFQRRDIELSSALEALKQRYLMVGLQERYPVSFLLLSSMAWRASLPTRRERVSSVRGDANSISIELRHRVMAVNKLDYEIYRAVENVYDRLAPAIWSEFSP